MTRRLTLACLVALSLAACGEQPAGEPADASPDVATEAATPATEPVATLVPTGPANPDSDFDRRGFAGSFGGTLPCASCPGIDTTLQLDADGSYTLTEVYQEQEDGAFQSEGTWTAEADDMRIRLDPASKADEDRLYAIESDDRLVQLGADGEPAAHPDDYALTRTAPAAR